MRLDLGSPVRCSDAVFGRLADIVVDPTTSHVTHLIVEAHESHVESRLVPVELATAGEGGELRLSCSVREAEVLPAVDVLDYLRMGEFPVADPEWDVGVVEMFALPYYQATDLADVGAPSLDQGVSVRYDRVPKGEVEIRRKSAVISADDHAIGHVDGFVVDEAQGISHVVLEHGHLWGKREIAIPIANVATVENDTIALSLTKAEVEALESLTLDRRHLRHRRENRS